MSLTLTSIPVEIILHILRFLEVKDVINLRKICRFLDEITHHWSVWFNILRNDIVQQGIPVPGSTQFHASSASPRDLEDMYIRAQALRRNWILPRPQPAHHISFNLDQTGPTADVTSQASLSPSEHLWCLALYFLPGRDNRYLVCILRRETVATPPSPGRAQRILEVQCWDIAMSEDELRSKDSKDRVDATKVWSGSRCIARYRCTGLLAACVNVDPTHPACLLVTERSEISSEAPPTSLALSIDFNAADTSRSLEAFQVYSSFASYKTAMRLHGSLFFATDETSCMRILDIDSGNVLYSLQPPLFRGDVTVLPEECRCLNTVMVGRFVLIFRQRYIHLYVLPEANTSPTPEHTVGTVLQHVSEHQWLWRIDSLDVMVEQPHSLHDQFFPPDTHRRPPSIRIFLRFGSIFPWPVNMLHTYVLPPNPSFDADNSHDQCIADRTRLPYLPAGPESDALKPYLLTSINSPVRIFTPSDTVMSAYGTVLWMDAQTEQSAVGQAADRGQRVAGRLLDFRRRPEKTGPQALPRHAVDLVADNTRPLSRESEGGGSGRAEEPYGGSEMLFHVQEQAEDWVRVAMCEEEGMIVLGTARGKISVYWYV